MRTHNPLAASPPTQRRTTQWLRRPTPGQSSTEPWTRRRGEVVREAREAMEAQRATIAQALQKATEDAQKMADEIKQVRLEVCEVLDQRAA
jgi:hypothetical protein